MLAFYLLPERGIVLGSLSDIAQVLFLLLFMAALTFQCLARILSHFKRITGVDQTAIDLGNRSAGLVSIAFLVEDRFADGWA